ncbi:MAG TPA: alpha/beta fold hydrolase [Dyella sp.]|nr:alpha/beta fold hydrolase [Dyella sp.]
MNADNSSTESTGSRPFPGGTWHGTIETERGELAWVVHLHHDEDGLEAIADLPMRQGIRLADAACEGDMLRFRSQTLGEFHGRISSDGQAINGAIHPPGRLYPAKLEHGAPPVRTMARPQQPKPPFDYHVEEVRFAGAAPDVLLAGTLVRPSHPRAAVVLVTGSGALDRDETAFGHKPFHVLADYLAQRGYAVLRVDDRGVGASTGSRDGITMADEAADAALAVGYLRQRHDLRGLAVGLIGHSTGGLVATMVAVDQGEAVFVVSLAGPGHRLGEELTLRECAELARMGRSAGDISRYATFARALREHVGDLPAEAVIQAADIVGIGVATSASNAAIAHFSGEASLRQLNLPWFRHAYRLDPAPLLRRLRVPYLAMTGALDTQVIAASSLARMREALAAHSDAEVIELPGLNHLFQHCSSGSPLEYAQIEETFSPSALERLTDWLDQRFGCG